MISQVGTDFPARTEAGVGMPLPARVGDAFRQAVGLVVFFGGAYVAGGVAWILAACGWRRHDRAFWQAAARSLLGIWRWIAGGLGILRCEGPGDRFFEGERGTIFVANHPSLMDGLVLLATIPRAVCVMRGGLRHDPAFATLSRLAGFLPSTSGTALAKAGIQSLARGENVIIFPEGTRSHSDRPGPFKAGFALIAKHSKAPVQTLHVHFEGEYFRKGRSLFRPSRLPVRLRFEVGRRFQILPGESAEAFAGRVEEEFRIQGRPS